MLLLQLEMLVLFAGCADSRLAQALVLHDYYFYGFSVIRFRDNLLCDWRRLTPHAYSVGVLICGILFLIVTSQLSDSEQDTESLSPRFFHP